MTIRNEVRVRPADPGDEPFLLGLMARLAEFPTPAWRSPAEIAAADHAILREALHRPRPDAIIRVAATAEGSPLGYVFATTQIDYFTKEPIAHVEVLALAPEAEGRGLARLLMENAESWARERGYRRVTLNVFDGNSRARGLYQRLGYLPETIHYLKEL
jgi:GNAT superfamily N-acetyltransferase